MGPGEGHSLAEGLHLELAVLIVDFSVNRGLGQRRLCDMPPPPPNLSAGLWGSWAHCVHGRLGVPSFADLNKKCVLENVI